MRARLLSLLVAHLLVLVGAVQVRPVLADALSDLPRANVTFVTPVIGPDGNISQVGDRLVFEEVVAGKDSRTDAVRAHLATNSAWELVCRLYGFAWQRNGGQGPGDFVLAVTDMFGSIGPSHAGSPVLVKRADGTQLQAGSFLILSDIPAPPAGTDGPDLTLEVLMKNDYLGLALAHESAHQVMWDRYGPKDFPRNASQTRGGHDTHEITDPSLAFSEGWAEGFAAIVGDLLEASGRVPKQTEPALKELLKRRHEMVERDRYIYGDVLKKNGRMKTGMQLVSTEGAVAFLVYQSYANRIMRKQGQPAAYGAVLDTLSRHRPKHLVDFWNATMSDVPNLRDKLMRIFLEGTRYSTVSAQAPARYLEHWTTKQAANKLPKDHPGKADAEKDAYAIEKAYTSWKDGLYADALKSGRLDGALPPGLDPLWLDHGLRRVGLNLATPEELADFRKSVMGEREDHLLRSEALLEARDGAQGRGFLADVEALASLATPEEMAAMRTARQEYIAASARAAAEANVSAYLSHRGPHAIHHRLAQLLGAH